MRSQLCCALSKRLRKTKSYTENNFNSAETYGLHNWGIDFDWDVSLPKNVFNILGFSYWGLVMPYFAVLLSIHESYYLAGILVPSGLTSWLFLGRVCIYRSPQFRIKFQIHFPNDSHFRIPIIFNYLSSSFSVFLFFWDIERPSYDRFHSHFRSIQ